MVGVLPDKLKIFDAIDKSCNSLLIEPSTSAVKYPLLATKAST